MSGRVGAIKFADLPETFVADATTMTNEQLAEKYNRAVVTIVRWRRVAKVPSPFPAGTRVGVNQWTFPNPESKNYSEAGILLIEGDCVITSDWHIPYHSLDLAEKMLRLATKQKIKQLAIVGDFFDAATLSVYDPQDIEFNIKEELNTTAQTLRHLLRFFDRIYWSLGNHEVRLLRMLKFQIDMTDVAKWLWDNPRIISTPYPHMILDSEGERYRLTHPRSYSRIPGRVAQVLAAKFKMHVMMGHDHLYGDAMEPSNTYRAIGLGGMFDPHKLVYPHVGGDTTHPEPTPAFWIVRKGEAVGYRLHGTHWPSVLPEK